jgi:hypothetical protein
VVLGGRLVAAGGITAFRDDAVVHHRWLPGSFRDHLAQRRRLAGFPGLARRSPVLARALWRGVFLSSSTATFDAALAGAALALASRRPWWLLLALPWLRRRLPDARSKRSGRPAAARLGQLAVADLVGLASLVEGSARHRRLVL